MVNGGKRVGEPIAHEHVARNVRVDDDRLTRASQSGSVDRSSRSNSYWAFLWWIRRSTLPRRSPLARFSRLGDPPQPSLVPQKTEPLAHYCSNPTPDRPAGPPGASP